MASRPAHAHDTARSERTLERAATWLSLACAVHCLLVPVAMALMPLLGTAGWAHLPAEAELALTLLVVTSAVAGSAWGYRRHGDGRVVAATGLGLIAYLFGHLLEDSWYGIGLAVLGALLLAASSYLSARLAHSCADASCAS